MTELGFSQCKVEMLNIALDWLQPCPLNPILLEPLSHSIHGGNYEEGGGRAGLWLWVLPHPVLLVFDDSVHQKIHNMALFHTMCYTRTKVLNFSKWCSCVAHCWIPSTSWCSCQCKVNKWKAWHYSHLPPVLVFTTMGNVWKEHKSPYCLDRFLWGVPYLLKLSVQLASHPVIFKILSILQKLKRNVSG